MSKQEHYTNLGVGASDGGSHVCEKRLFEGLLERRKKKSQNVKHGDASVGQRKKREERDDSDRFLNLEDDDDDDDVEVVEVSLS